MTRHQRKRKAIKLAVLRARQELVKDNLSHPACYFQPRGNLVSHAYDGVTDRARVQGSTPIAGDVQMTLPGTILGHADKSVNATPSGPDKNGKMRINIRAFHDNRMNKKTK